MCRQWRQRTPPAENRAPAKRLRALKVAANLRAAIVDGAELCDAIEGNARAVPMLVHAADAIVFDHILLWHVIHQGRELDKQMAALAAAGTGRKIFGSDEHQWSAEHAQIRAAGEQSFRTHLPLNPPHSRVFHHPLAGRCTAGVGLIL